MVPQSPNLLLASLGGPRYRKPLPKLSTLFVRSGDELQHCGSTRVYFPGDGLSSMRTVMRDGRVIELAAVGREGLVGYSPAENGSPASVRLPDIPPSQRTLRALAAGRSREELDATNSRSRAGR